MLSTFPDQLAIAAVAGVGTHALYLNRGERHMQVPRYVQLVFLSWILGVGLYYRFAVNSTLLTAAYDSTILHTAYFSGIYSSLLIYRLFLNPLNKFPGPFGSRLSSLTLSWRVRKGDGHIQLAKLHSQYGHFVRITPGEISVSHPEAIELIQGPASKCIKGSNYDVAKPFASLQLTRDKTEHALRRKVWNPAFSERAIRGYDQRIRVYQDRLVSKLVEREGRPVEFSQLIMWYSFDVMGDMAFGRSYNMLETSKNHWAIDLAEAGLKPVRYYPPMWFMRLALAIPGLTRDWYRYFDFCRDSMLERRKTTPDIPDVMSFVLAPHEKSQELTPHELMWLTGDSQLIISAGSDTSAATIVASIYYLVRNPSQMEKLRRELDPLWAERPAAAAADSTGIPPEKLATLNHLNGVINEALRLLPPVPTQTIRQTPPEGITVAGTHIPGGVDVWSPQYIVGRDENNYAHADSFIPERWYSSPELVKDPRVFVPFTIGPYNCIGKPLALMNIRSVISKLVCNFDIDFAPGEDGSRVEKEAVDNFIVRIGPVDLTFKTRAI
ncbi:cytochrome P450 [Cladorrhinum sp. PSN259]|nr:cytochrome P450 [Cladorrhinum sp. PSN259]